MSFARRLCLLLAVLLVLSSLLAPFVAWGLGAAFGDAHRFSFPRVFDRVLQVLAVGAFIGGRRWLERLLVTPAGRADLLVGSRAR